MACMALNILVGIHGPGLVRPRRVVRLGAYAAALAAARAVARLDRCSRSSAALALVALIAWAFGFLILRRRGVYFSLLTMALSAMLYVVAFRWTAVTGGENGLGGIVRPDVAGFRLETNATYYALVAAIAFVVVYVLWRFHRSPVGHVLVAIRENEQRARFIGYPTNRYKLSPSSLSATLTGLAGCLLLFNNRMTSADPISVAFSGELLAMVVDRRHALVPRAGAGRAVLRDLPRLPLEHHRELAALVRPAVRRLHPVLADGARRRRRARCSRRSARRPWRPPRWPAARSATSRCPTS